MVARSDVVVENFSSGVMERLGLDYPRLRAINPRLIMASSSAHGRTGPDRERVAYGTLIQCFTGWAELSAHPGRPPRSAAGVWTDPLTAVFETLLVLAALWRQRTEGTGGLYDLSMAEATIAALPEPILAWCLNQEVLQARGNRHPVWAPQGCYPAQGEDRWVALSVQSDAEWASLCGLMDRDDLLGDIDWPPPTDDASTTTPSTRQSPPGPPRAPATRARPASRHTGSLLPPRWSPRSL